MKAALARLDARFVLAFVALGVSGANGGCALLNNLSVPTPTAQIVGVHLADLNLLGADLVFDVQVNNPYAVDLPLANLDYQLSSQGRSFLQGQAKLQGLVPAHSSQVFPMSSKVVFLDVLKILTDVRPGALIPFSGTLVV